MIMGVPVAVPVKWKIEFCCTLLQPIESFNRSTPHQWAFAGKLQIWVCNFHGQLKVSKADQKPQGSYGSIHVATISFEDPPIQGEITTKYR